MPVGLGAILNDQLRRVQTKQHGGTQRNPKNMTLFPKFSIHMAWLKCARVNKSIIYIIMRKE